MVTLELAENGLADLQKVDTQSWGMEGTASRVVKISLDAFRWPEVMMVENFGGNFSEAVGCPIIIDKRYHSAHLNLSRRSHREYEFFFEVCVYTNVFDSHTAIVFASMT